MSNMGPWFIRYPLYVTVCVLLLYLFRYLFHSIGIEACCLVGYDGLAWGAAFILGILVVNATFLIVHRIRSAAAQSYDDAHRPL
jgi:hypothetical protein